MRTFVAAITAAGLLTGSAFAPALASDPFNGQSWQKSRPPAALAYFKFRFHPPQRGEKLSYGLALTAPTPRVYGSSPLLMNDAPRLVDLRFNGGLPHSLLLSEREAWSIAPGQGPEGARHNHLIGGPIGWAFNLALTAAAVYGVYTLVKKECPAISTTTGGCVETAN